MGHAPVYGDDDFEYDDNTSNEFDTFCQNSMCCRIHTAEVPGDAGCIATWLGFANGASLLFIFGYVLRKLFRSNRRSRAGYTKNTVSLDTHMSLLEGTLVWAVAWGLFQVFSFKDGSQNLPPPQHSDGHFTTTVTSTALMYGASEAFGLLILLLLVSESIGQHHLNRALRVAGAWGITVSGAIVAVMRWEQMCEKSGSGCTSENNSTTPTVPVGLNLCLAGVAALDIVYVALAISHARAKAPERAAVRTYGFFMGSVGCILLAARLMLLPMPMQHLNGAGLCVLDAATFVYFSLFAPIVYVTLKDDSSYWMLDDVGHGGLWGSYGHASSSIGLLGFNDSDDEDDDEERRALVDWGDRTLSEELPIFEDVVIPKTELYMRKRIDDRIDIAIEVHLWRRSLVVVKRFKLDFLTRDNIVLFKKEASVLRRLSHPNVIQFYGVVIDPPCMAIVMAYGSRGDLFTHLRKLNRALMNARRSSSLWEGNGNGRSPWLQSADGASSVVQSNANSTHDSSSRSSAAASAIHSGGSAAARGSLLESGLSFCPLKCALDVATGMKYLHSHGMVHCDLKSANVLLDANWVAKIADFGDVREAALHPSASLSSTVTPSSSAMRPSGAALSHRSGATPGSGGGDVSSGSARSSGGRHRNSSGFRPSSLSGNINGSTSLTRRRNGGAAAEGSALVEGGGRGSSWMGGWRDSYANATTDASAAAEESKDEGRFAANSALLVSRLSDVESDVSAGEVKCGMFGFGSPSEKKTPASGGQQQQQQQASSSRSPPPSAPTPEPARPLEANMRFGTVGWASPELVVGNQEPSFASDAFAMGTLLWELATFKQPFLLVARREEGLRGRSLSRSSSFASTQDGFLDRSGHGLLTPSMTSSSLLPPDPTLTRASSARDSESRSSHGGLGFHAFGAAVGAAGNTGSSGSRRGSESERGLTGGWADLLRDDLARSYHEGSDAHSAAAGVGGGARVGGGQQDANDADGFNSRQLRVGRAERDRRAAIMRGGSAVLSRAGEVATSWSSSRHRRRQQQMMQPPSSPLSPHNTTSGGGAGVNVERASLGGESFVSSLSSASVTTGSKAVALLEAQRAQQQQRFWEAEAADRAARFGSLPLGVPVNGNGGGSANSRSLGPGAAAAAAVGFTTTFSPNLAPITPSPQSGTSSSSPSHLRSPSTGAAARIQEFPSMAANTTSFSVLQGSDMAAPLLERSNRDDEQEVDSEPLPSSAQLPYGLAANDAIHEGADDATAVADHTTPAATTLREPLRRLNSAVGGPLQPQGSSSSISHNNANANPRDSSTNSHRPSASLDDLAMLNSHSDALRWSVLSRGDAGDAGAAGPTPKLMSGGVGSGIGGPDLGGASASRSSGVRAVEVRTPEDALELMVVAKYRPPLPVRAPAGFVDLMRECWRADGAARPDFATCVARLEVLHATNQQLVAAAAAGGGRGSGGGRAAPAVFPCGIANFANIDD